MRTKAASVVLQPTIVRTYSYINSLNKSTSIKDTVFKGFLRPQDDTCRFYRLMRQAAICFSMMNYIELLLMQEHHLICHTQMWRRWCSRTMILNRQLKQPCFTLQSSTCPNKLCWVTESLSRPQLISCVPLFRAKNWWQPITIWSDVCEMDLQPNIKCSKDCAWPSDPGTEGTASYIQYLIIKSCSSVSPFNWSILSVSVILSY